MKSRQSGSRNRCVAVARRSTVVLTIAALARGQLTGLVPLAFTPEECDEIVQLFTGMERQEDVRENPLLPLMGTEPFGVARISRFDDGSRPEMIGQLHERVLAHARSFLVGHVPSGVLTSAAAFSTVVDFTLLHEFRESHDRFDWHTDTRPGDGTGRTLNLNLMLSRAGEDYTGGALHVGSETITPRQGDLYAYPAALPHKVGALASGSRYTLIVALTERKLPSALDGEGASSNSSDPRDRAYWRAVEAAFGDLLLASRGGLLAHEPKVHILYGEFLEAAGRADEAQRAFCGSYRAADGPSDGVSFARRFYALGVEALQAERPDLHRAESYLAMAACVDPELEEASAALGVVRDALAIVRRRDDEHGVAAGERERDAAAVTNDLGDTDKSTKEEL